MAKKVWISLPLITTADATDATVVGFTKGGQKKELEFEVAVFITKWLMDKSVPFGIDFESSCVDREGVLAALPRRLQRILGFKAPGSAEPSAEEGPGEAAEPEGGAVGEGGGEVEPVSEVAAENPFGGGESEAADSQEASDEPPATE